MILLITPPNWMKNEGNYQKCGWFSANYRKIFFASMTAGYPSISFQFILLQLQNAKKRPGTPSNFSSPVLRFHWQVIFARLTNYFAPWQCLFWGNLSCPKRQFNLSMNWKIYGVMWSFCSHYSVIFLPFLQRMTSKCSPDDSSHNPSGRGRDEGNYQKCR